MSGLAVAVAVLSFGIGVCVGALAGLFFHLHQIDALKRSIERGPVGR